MATYHLELTNSPGVVGSDEHDFPTDAHALREARRAAGDAIGDELQACVPELQVTVVVTRGDQRIAVISVRATVETFTS